MVLTYVIHNDVSNILQPISIEIMHFIQAPFALYLSNFIRPVVR